MGTSYHKPNEVQVNTFYDRAEKRFYTMPALTRQNPYQLKRLTKRCLSQLEIEQVDTYGFVHVDYTAMYRQNLYRKKVKCRVFLQNDGPAIILSKLGNHKLPSDPGEKMELIKSWIVNIPKGRSIGGNNDFGGGHAGFYFPPKYPGRSIKINLEMWDVEMILDDDKVEHRTKNEYDIVIIGMSNEKAEEYVRDKLVWG